MGNTNLFTIIVPIYNVEKYLDQCLESLAKQSVMNHTVILVNDGSTDGSDKIAKMFVDKYPSTFRLIEQENLGLGAARNTGLKQVDTEWVGFLDSDDWVPNTYIEILTKRIENERIKPDIVFTLPVVFDMADSLYKNWMDKTLYENIFATNGIINVTSVPQIMALEPSVNRRIFRTSFLTQNHFSFPEGTKWEDVEPHFQLLHLANICIAECETGFVYRVNSGGQITSTVGSDRLHIVNVFSNLFYRMNNENYTNIELSYALKMLLGFSTWSIDCCSNEIRVSLLEGLHSLWRSIPQNQLDDYYKEFNVNNGLRNYIKRIRSPLYHLMKSPIKYESLKTNIKKILPVDRG